MKTPSHNDPRFDSHPLARLEAHYVQVEATILSRQDPITGLLPASTAITVHGDYTHAWVRDNVYSILAVWGLAQAYRRQGGDPGRIYRLEQSVVKLMRGLLVAMMKQAAKVERFKQLPDPLHALHAKYDTRTGEPVVGDDQWGHLQLDATALFLLMLAQMTASGLRIVFTPEEVALVQNLVHYLSRAYVTPDFGIWERGHKMNEGQAELNASSLGMVKAALEALRGCNLYGKQGGPESVIQVVADDIARARSTLEALLPRESHSKEIDAALLSVIGYPAFAVEDTALAERTRNEIVAKLQGRYGCKRFLRDGHQTVLEDHNRLHYQAGELKAFEHIESEWPLFFTYLLLDYGLRGDEAGARDYRRRLEGLLVERDGQHLLPELYYVPAEAVAAEKAAPGSQLRVPNDNLPLVWAQSLFILGALLQEGLIEAGDIDPLGRRLRLGQGRNTRVGVALLAESPEVQSVLAGVRVAAELAEDIPLVQVHHAQELAIALEDLGRESRLGLSGRPRQRLDTLATCQVYGRGKRTLVFLPAFLSSDGLFLNRDNRLLVQRLRTELAYISRHWDQPGQPLLTLMVGAAMLEAGGHDELLALLDELRAGSCQGVAVQLAPLAQQLSQSR
ncbi:MAG: glycoside hydrolase family 15 protein, partial [Candidatus Competibacteraceae bacterium]|nr:glycoside hydrolase family 15 protein [Candidatus Competibacteraceae bacterium]